MSSTVVYNAVLCDAGGKRRGWLAADGGRITAVGDGNVTAEMLVSAAEAVDARGAFEMTAGLTRPQGFKDTL